MLLYGWTVRKRSKWPISIFWWSNWMEQSEIWWPSIFFLQKMHYWEERQSVNCTMIFFCKLKYTFNVDYVNRWKIYCIFDSLHRLTFDYSNPSNKHVYEHVNVWLAKQTTCSIHYDHCSNIHMLPLYLFIDSSFPVLHQIFTSATQDTS